MKIAYKRIISRWLKDKLPKASDTEADSHINAFSLGLMTKDVEFGKKYNWKPVTEKKFPAKQHIILWYPKRGGNVEDIYIGHWPKYDYTFDGAYYIKIADLIKLKK